MPDRHAEKPLSLRLGADRQAVEAAAEAAGMPLRAWLQAAAREKLARDADAPAVISPQVTAAMGTVFQSLQQAMTVENLTRAVVEAYNRQMEHAGGRQQE
jgi:hypothetical protein